MWGQGFEIGSGFDGSRQLGSEHNDEFYMEDGNVRTRTNRRVPLLAVMQHVLSVIQVSTSLFIFRAVGAMLVCRQLS